MEDSMNSSGQRALASQGTAGSPHEESGWTAYFEDFTNNREDSFVSSSFGGSSLVSDAATGAAWKTSLHNNHAAASSSIGVSPNLPKKLRFKKTRTREISNDDSLEDTASSPVNSPKVSDIEQIDMNTRRPYDHIDSSLGKTASASYNYSEGHTDERSKMNFRGKNDCTDLKRRGLCLVPLSMLVNYLG